MFNFFLQLMLFFSKSIILVVMLLVLLAGILALLSKGKNKPEGRISIKNLNKKYDQTRDDIYTETLTKDKLKQHFKTQKATAKLKMNATEKSGKNIYILNFCGDIKATAVAALREEITAILSVAVPGDEVVVCVESGGGMVHAYGLAAAQLARLRDKSIPLTVIVDKVAASGGYLMASVANTILAAPFAIIGSIGVIVQLPNFHRLLKEKKIDFEQLTAGDFKRTLTMFGPNTEAGKEKLQLEIEEIHDLFKQSIQQYRPQLDMNKVATGEHWLGMQAFDLRLVDGVKTSDDYLFENSKDSNLYALNFEMKKSFGNKLASMLGMLKENLFHTSNLL
ncbi:MAG: protease SohB [Gammaproteobacteria bacterium]|nr:protease SohB [Gammaproteobacteria bacterium]